MLGNFPGSIFRSYQSREKSELKFHPVCLITPNDLTLYRSSRQLPKDEIRQEISIGDWINLLKEPITMLRDHKKDDHFIPQA